MDAHPTVQFASPKGVVDIVSEIKNTVGGVLLSNSKYKYELKSKIIENATDMTTKEKLDAMDANYDRHVVETVRVACVSLGLLIIYVVIEKSR